MYMYILVCLIISKDKLIKINFKLILLNYILIYIIY